MSRLDPNSIESDVLELGRSILTEAQSPSQSLFRTEFYAQKLMAWGMQDEDFKVALFRFVDVLPSLPDSRAIISHVNEYFIPLREKIPPILRAGLGITPGSITGALAAAAIKKQVEFVAQNFIVGESAKSSLRALRKIRQRGQAFTVDLLGEAALSEVEAREYQRRYLELLACLAAEVPRWKERAPRVEGHRGEVTAINISVKPSSIYSQAKPTSIDRSQRIIAERLEPIFLEAKKCGAFVYIDMEDSSLTSATLEASKLLLSTPQLRDYDRVGVVLQAYLRRSDSDLNALLAWTKKRGTPIAVRLVKGAYWDTETLMAQQRRWPIPVWQNKSSSDANFEKLALKLLENHSLFFPAFGSHNVRSLCFAIQAADRLGLKATDFEIQMLYGMAGPIKQAFSERGFLVREYSPIGEILPGMAYLVRRLLENTSNEGFLRQSLHENASTDRLLRKPEMATSDTGVDHLQTDIRSSFVNEPPIDFSLPEERSKLSAEIARQQHEFALAPSYVRPIVNGRSVDCHRHIFSTSPEDPGLTLARIDLADEVLVSKALQSLDTAFLQWRSVPIAKRAEYLFQAADILKRKRFEMIATIIIESGKPWIEADGDVAEAIDFLTYYAHEALRLFSPRNFGSCPGEDNSYFYEPRGIAVVISPWNFPLAIPCGMFAAALVTGNTVVLKPAEQTSFIAKLLFDIFLEAGVPENVIAFLPGFGEEIGPALVNDFRVATVVFTGSKAVGLHLLAAGALSSPGAVHVKRVITEMGGKNAIIIDQDADMDEAVRATVYSAFGFQGQKCSACSRVILVGSSYDRFLERFGDAVRSLDMGPASHPDTVIGPVIDDEAQERILRRIAEAKKDCRVVSEGRSANELGLHDGYYVSPIAFSDIPDNHFLLREEIFGPVLAIIPAPTFEKAVEIANDVEYGLTGGVFSRSPANIDYARNEFRVGNLYINRGCTGAIVKRHPFGGAKMSGIGSKAGGPDYLLQFVIPRAVSENTIRRGFAPQT